MPKLFEGRPIPIDPESGLQVGSSEWREWHLDRAFNVAHENLRAERKATEQSSKPTT
jgi:hypothetical protein